MNLSKQLLSLSILCTSAIYVGAQDQKGYHLFNPAPKDEMREFSIDRPDVTESPITVDAGHFQFEGDLIKWTKHFQSSESPNTINYMNALYKFGLTGGWDIHIGLELHNVLRDSEGNTIDDGYGATTIRLKRNFWGNDGSTKTAFGMIPYVTFVEGNPFDSKANFGIGLPFAYALNDQYDLGAQPQIDFLLDENGNHKTSFFQTVVLGGPMIGDLDFFIEGLFVIPPDGDNQLLIDGGLIYNVNPNTKIDIAANVGMTEEAPTRVYLGLSFRL